ncbi:MAG TPA: TadE/TadG family type IV pilus assembly protein [Rhizomicrobium sp.]|nr:TadE/TadG family type IV pilus assembly protein [Rhizomicrobium sp.]
MLKTLNRFRAAKSGLAAIEFALILPAMLALLFGSIEVTNILIVKSDTTNIASTAADLVAQESTVSNSDITNVFNALNALVYPYSATGMRVVITSVIDDGKGGGKVGWSDTNSGTARTKGAAVTVPTGLITTGGSVIMAEVTYSYTTPSTYLVKLPVTLSNTFYSHPRRVAQIARTN